MKGKNILQQLLNGNVDREFYKRNSEQLANRNFRMIKIGFIFSTLMNLFLFSLTFVNELMFPLTKFYLVFTIWFAGWTVVVFIVSKQENKKFSKMFFIVLATSLLLLSAIIGTLHTRDMYAVAFYVFLIFVPGLYVDRPLTSIITIALACIGFCIMVKTFKIGDEIISNDILNAVCCSIVSVGFNIYSININLENIEATIILKEQSIIDELTSLPNRRYFNRKIEEIFSQEIEGEVSIIMMDVDFFKLYNDGNGHLKGDECLAQIGKQLHRTAEKYGIFVARYGGEEFIAIDSINKAKMTEVIANAFVRDIENLKIPNLNSTYKCITLSAGWANYRGSGAENYMKLINLADKALYNAKSEGRNRSMGIK